MQGEGINVDLVVYKLEEFGAVKLMQDFLRGFRAAPLILGSGRCRSSSSRGSRRRRSSL